MHNGFYAKKLKSCAGRIIQMSCSVIVYIRGLSVTRLSQGRTLNFQLCVCMSKLFNAVAIEIANEWKPNENNNEAKKFNREPIGFILRKLRLIHRPKTKDQSSFALNKRMNVRNGAEEHEKKVILCLVTTFSFFICRSCIIIIFCYCYIPFAVVHFTISRRKINFSLLSY